MNDDLNRSSRRIVLDFQRERARAHSLHAADSCEDRNWDDPEVFRTWIEEIMEAIQVEVWARQVPLYAGTSRLREELVQVGAMTVMWIARIDAARQAAHDAGYIEG